MIKKVNEQFFSTPFVLNTAIKSSYETNRVWWKYGRFGEQTGEETTNPLIHYWLHESISEWQIQNLLIQRWLYGRIHTPFNVMYRVAVR